MNGSSSLRLLASAAIALVALMAPSALAAEPDAHAADASAQLLLVHGYGEYHSGKDCNGETWVSALRYFQDVRRRPRSSISTIGYYVGDRAQCDATVGRATNKTPIQDIAKDFAWYVYRTYSAKGEPVNIVGHSMGGLIARVALLGAGQHWHGFPPKLNVTNVVTLSTPHQGVAAPGAHHDRQWSQMNPHSGFMRRLHETGSGLDDAWAHGTDWSLVGSAEDQTVTYKSGIDKGNYADEKYGYLSDHHDAGNVDHGGARTLFGENRYDLNYWHAWGNDRQHHTLNGWSPLKTAFQAATKIGDGLPR